MNDSVKKIMQLANKKKNLVKEIETIDAEIEENKKNVLKDEANKDMEFVAHLNAYFKDATFCYRANRIEMRSDKHKCYEIKDIIFINTLEGTIFCDTDLMTKNSQSFFSYCNIKLSYTIEKLKIYNKHVSEETITITLAENEDNRATIFEFLKQYFQFIKLANKNLKQLNANLKLIANPNDYKKYIGRFKCDLDVAYEFEHGYFNVETIVAAYLLEYCQGAAYVLFRKNDTLYEVEAFHNSLNGLEGQFGASEVTLEYLLQRVEKGEFLRGADPDGEIKKSIIAWLAFFC